MKIREVAIILRRDGVFHLPDRNVKSVYPNAGYAVLVFLERSPIDEDFNTFVWVPSTEDLKKIKAALDESDSLTFALLGHGWSNGPRPYEGNSVTKVLGGP